MGKHKNVFKEAVSEMKHFLVGAGLVLTLVAVVPALAQMPPHGGDIGGTGMQQQQPMGGQLGPSNILPGGGTAELGQGHQSGMQQQGQLGQQSQFPGQGKGVEGGFPGQGEGVESGFPSQGLGKEGSSKEDMIRKFKGRSGDESENEEQVTKWKKGVNKWSENAEQTTKEKKGRAENMWQQFTQSKKGSDSFGEVSEKPVAKKQPQFKLQPINFDDLEDDTSSTAVSAVAESIVNPALATIESGIVSKKKTKSFIKKVSKALFNSAKQVCSAFEEDAEECVDVYKSFQDNLKKIRSTEALAKALQVFMDDLNALSTGGDESEAEEEEFLEEEIK